MRLLIHAGVILCYTFLGYSHRYFYWIVIFILLFLTVSWYVNLFGPKCSITYYHYSHWVHWWRPLQPTSSVITDAKSADLNLDDFARVTTVMCQNISRSPRFSQLISKMYCKSLASQRNLIVDIYMYIYIFASYVKPSVGTVPVLLRRSVRSYGWGWGRDIPQERCQYHGCRQVINNHGIESSG